MSHFVVGAIRHALGSEDLGCMNELAKFIEYDVIEQSCAFGLLSRSVLRPNMYGS